MSDSVRDLLVRGIAAAKDNDVAAARRYLERALWLDPSRDQAIDAWFWLSKISTNPKEKRDYLEQVLAWDTMHSRAKRELAILEGRLDPDDIVDPNLITVQAPESPRQAQAKQFECSQCGGRMTYTPDGKRLICEYCSMRKRRTGAGTGAQSREAVKEQDFVAALSTAKGHLRPVATRCLACRECGASFVLAPEKISFTCPYCGSVYVVEETETKVLVPPGAVIPFDVTRQEAIARVNQWLAHYRLDHLIQISPPEGMYVAGWTFDIVVEVAVRYQDEETGAEWVERKTYLADDVLVPANAETSGVLRDKVLPSFDLDGVVTYQPDYLADWPAQTYEISMADASLKARAKVRDDLQRKTTWGVGVFQRQGAQLSVDFYKLVLLPVWVARYRDDERAYTVWVNGQTGAVYGERPLKGLRKFISRLAE